MVAASNGRAGERASTAGPKTRSRSLWMMMPSTGSLVTPTASAHHLSAHADGAARCCTARTRTMQARTQARHDDTTRVARSLSLCVTNRCNEPPASGPGAANRNPCSATASSPGQGGQRWPGTQRPGTVGGGPCLAAAACWTPFWGSSAAIISSSSPAAADRPSGPGNRHVAVPQARECAGAPQSVHTYEADAGIIVIECLRMHHARSDTIVGPHCAVPSCTISCRQSMKSTRRGATRPSLSPPPDPSSPDPLARRPRVACHQTRPSDASLLTWVKRVLVGSSFNPSSAGHGRDDFVGRDTAMGLLLTSYCATRTRTRLTTFNMQTDRSSLGLDTARTTGKVNILNGPGPGASTPELPEPDMRATQIRLDSIAAFAAVEYFVSSILVRLGANSNKRHIARGTGSRKIRGSSCSARLRAATPGYHGRAFACLHPPACTLLLHAARRDAVRSSLDAI